MHIYPFYSRLFRSWAYSHRHTRYCALIIRQASILVALDGHGSQTPHLENRGIAHYIIINAN